jgi:hypothetical protein
MKIIAVKKHIFSNGVFPREKFWFRSFEQLLGIPILINSKDHIEATRIPTQSLTERRCIFY